LEISWTFALPKKVIKLSDLKIFGNFLDFCPTKKVKKISDLKIFGNFLDFCLTKKKEKYNTVKKIEGLQNPICSGEFLKIFLYILWI
jgi:hypothetical protein